MGGQSAGAGSGSRAEVLVPTGEFDADMAFLNKTLGFRLEEIYPADNPKVAVMSGHGLRLRLDSTERVRESAAMPELWLHVEDPDALANGPEGLLTPGGMTIHPRRINPGAVIPATEHSYVVRRLADEAPWVIGRAGMHYRDLIPDRLGGSIIASHIRIPDGGPVPDMVHYHTVGFQLIFCIEGWVDLVYEDQGPQFRLEAGDCVIQPPEIRHRVLHASSDVEVLEIGVPAEHVTTIDHDMALPNGPANPDRRFQGQRFVRYLASQADFTDWRLPGFMASDTGIAEGTRGVAGVKVVRPRQDRGEGAWAKHDCDILFAFLRRGGMRLRVEGEPDHDLGVGDAFVLPPGRKAGMFDCSGDLELIEVALPGAFRTEVAREGKT